MKNFKQGGFNKGGFGDRKPFGGKPSFGGRSDFSKKPWDKGGKDFGGDKQMHPATCSSCGKACQVPFRPSGGKEVFCNDCFGKVKGDETFVRNDSRSDFSRPASGGQNIDAVVRQLQVVASKLDQLIVMMNSQAKQAPQKSVEKKEVTPVASAPEVVAKEAPAKKVVAKKVVTKKVVAKEAPAKKVVAKKVSKK